jgi:hypothetical protein
MLNQAEDHAILEHWNRILRTAEAGPRSAA